MIDGWLPSLHVLCSRSSDDVGEKACLSVIEIGPRWLCLGNEAEAATLYFMGHAEARAGVAEASGTADVCTIGVWVISIIDVAACMVSVKFHDGGEWSHGSADGESTRIHDTVVVG